MLTYKTTVIKKNILCGASCDRCTLELYVCDSGDIVGGHHFSYTFGYGTAYDGSNLNVTLCDSCISSLLGQFAGIKKIGENV